MADQQTRILALEDCYFSVAEAAEHICCSESYVWGLIARRKITPVRIGKRTIVTAAEIKRFMRAAIVE